MHIGFIGLGNMGSGMAANLLKSRGFKQVRHLEGGLDAVD